MVVIKHDWMMPFYRFCPSLGVYKSKILFAVFIQKLNTKDNWAAMVDVEFSIENHFSKFASKN